MVYFTCPNLCTVELNSLGRKPQGSRELSLDSWAGSIRDRNAQISARSDTPALAMVKKTGYLKALGQPEKLNAWHFL